MDRSFLRHCFAVLVLSEWGWMSLLPSSLQVSGKDFLCVVSCICSDLDHSFSGNCFFPFILLWLLVFQLEMMMEGGLRVLLACLSPSSLSDDSLIASCWWMLVFLLGGYPSRGRTGRSKKKRKWKRMKRREKGRAKTHKDGVARRRDVRGRRGRRGGELLLLLWWMVVILLFSSSFFFSSSKRTEKKKERGQKDIRP